MGAPRISRLTLATMVYNKKDKFLRFIVLPYYYLTLSFTFNDFWTNSTASLGPNTWNDFVFPSRKLKGKCNCIWKKHEASHLRFEGKSRRQTPHRPSQPRMMKCSLSVRSKEWTSGVAMTPTCIRYSHHSQLWYHF